MAREHADGIGKDQWRQVAIEKRSDWNSHKPTHDKTWVSEHMSPVIGDDLPGCNGVLGCVHDERLPIAAG